MLAALCTECSQNAMMNAFPPFTPHNFQQFCSICRAFHFTRNFSVFWSNLKRFEAVSTFHHQPQSFQSFLFQSLLYKQSLLVHLMFRINNFIKTSNILRSPFNFGIASISIWIICVFFFEFFRISWVIWIIWIIWAFQQVSCLHFCVHGTFSHFFEDLSTFYFAEYFWANKILNDMQINLDKYLGKWFFFSFVMNRR